MPLLDHFHPPLSRTHPRRAFHGAWAAAMARWLNAGVLPPGYYAVPVLDRAGPIEIDVAAMRDSSTHQPAPDAGETQPWTPPEPELALAVEWPAADGVRVEIYSDDGDPRPAAAVELVSPGNKDRTITREAFTSKCVDYLRRGCGLVVVDVVTTRKANLSGELLTALGADSIPAAAALSAVSYRSLGREGDGQLQAWPAALEVGQTLPTVPLWLGGEAAVPLDLEASHSAACTDLRIRHGELRIVT